MEAHTIVLILSLFVAFCAMIQASIAQARLNSLEKRLAAMNRALDESKSDYGTTRREVVKVEAGLFAVVGALTERVARLEKTPAVTLRRNRSKARTE